MNAWPCSHPEEFRREGQHGPYCAQCGMNLSKVDLSAFCKDAEAEEDFRNPSPDSTS